MKMQSPFTHALLLTDLGAAHSHSWWLLQGQPWLQRPTWLQNWPVTSMEPQDTKSKSISLGRIFQQAKLTPNPCLVWPTMLVTYDKIPKINQTEEKTHLFCLCCRFESTRGKAQTCQMAMVVPTHNSQQTAKVMETGQRQDVELKGGFPPTNYSLTNWPILLAVPSVWSSHRCSSAYVRWPFNLFKHKFKHNNEYCFILSLFI